MRKEQRQQEILDFLRAAGVLSPKELAEQLYMSLSTVYRDIHDLEGQKLLIRTAEGQVAIPGEQRYTPAPYKRNLYREEKIAIARSAAALIPPGATIHLDSSHPMRSTNRGSFLTALRTAAAEMPCPAQGTVYASAITPSSERLLSFTRRLCEPLIT